MSEQPLQETAQPSVGSSGTITLDGLTATAETVGSEQQPWGMRGWAYKYRVTVTAGDETYSCDAWGSIADRAERRQDAEGIAAMVVDELLSAAYDPDEFWDMALGMYPEGEAPERETIHKVEAVIDAAEKMYAVLDRNADAINTLRDSF